MAAKPTKNDRAQQLPADAGSSLLNLSHTLNASSPSPSYPDNGPPSSLASHPAVQPVSREPLEQSDIRGSQQSIRGTARRNNMRQRGERQRPRPHEIFNRNQALFEQMFTRADYKRFFTIMSNNAENMSTIDTMKANRDLETKIGGSPKKVSELRNGSLLVEVNNEQQSKRIVNITSLSTISVTVTEHHSLNKTKGTIRYKNFPQYTEEQIQRELEAYRVTEVQRFKTKIDGQLRNLDTYLLTFDSCYVPQDVKIGWTKLDVREYIPKPRRCFNCQQWGHGARTCRNENKTCINCAELYHGADCSNDPCCANCGDGHSATSKNCFYYKVEEETLGIQYKEKLSYRESKQKALKMMINTKTFSSVATIEPNKRTRKTQAPHTDSINIGRHPPDQAGATSQAVPPTQAGPPDRAGLPNQAGPQSRTSLSPPPLNQPVQTTAVGGASSGRKDSSGPSPSINRSKNSGNMGGPGTTNNMESQPSKENYSDPKISNQDRNTTSKIDAPKSPTNLRATSDSAIDVSRSIPQVSVSDSSRKDNKNDSPNRKRTKKGKSTEKKNTEKTEIPKNSNLLTLVGNSYVRNSEVNRENIQKTSDFRSSARSRSISKERREKYQRIDDSHDMEYEGTPIPSVMDPPPPGEPFPCLGLPPPPSFGRNASAERNQYNEATTEHKHWSNSEFSQPYGGYK